MKELGRLVRSYLRKIYSSTPIFYYPHQKVFRKEAREVQGRTLCERDTGLCLEAYPSSANSFAYVLMKNLNRNIKIAHHTHAIASLKRALKYKVPAVIVVRKPEEAVSSRLSRFGGDETQGLLEYIWFHNFVLTNKARLIILTFEELTANTYDSMKLVARKAQLCPPDSRDNMEEMKKKAASEINENYHKHHRVRTSEGYVPERVQAKDDVRSRVVNHRYFQAARAVYEQITQSLDRR